LSQVAAGVSLCNVVSDGKVSLLGGQDTVVCEGNVSDRLHTARVHRIVCEEANRSALENYMRLAGKWKGAIYEALTVEDFAFAAVVAGLGDVDVQRHGVLLLPKLRASDGEHLLNLGGVASSLNGVLQNGGGDFCEDSPVGNVHGHQSAVHQHHAVGIHKNLPNSTLIR
jgi:hypothetical protein